MRRMFLRSRSVHLILKFLAFLGPGKKGHISPAGIRRIVVMRFGGIGDCIVLTGMLNTLRVLCSGAEIILVTEPQYAAVYWGNPDVSRIIARERPKIGWRFWRILSDVLFFRGLSKPAVDLVFFVHNDPYMLACALFLRAKFKAGFDTNEQGFDFGLTHGADIYVAPHPASRAFHEIPLNERFHALVKSVFGSDVGSNHPYLVVLKSETEAVRRWLCENRIGRPRVIIALGGYNPIKIWPAERFAELARKVAADLKAFVLVLGGEEESRFRDLFGPDSERLRFLPGKLSLREAFSIVSESDLAVGNDTGLIHAAAVLGIQVVAIFGQTPPKVYGHMNTQYKIVQAEMNCVPCDLPECLFQNGFSSKTAPPCMESVDSGRVFREIEKSLHNGRNCCQDRNIQED